MIYVAITVFCIVITIGAISFCVICLNYKPRMPKTPPPISKTEYEVERKQFENSMK